ncbi:MAG: hypothetical protein WCV73_05285 [Patescibacteria group bacterium]|jgi:hypothetical protein
MKKSVIIISIILVIGALFFWQFKPKVKDNGIIENNVPVNNGEESSTTTPTASTSSEPIGQVPAPDDSGTDASSLNQLNLPLSSARERVTKKPFGIKISPQDSPVSPEKFSGYHTGVDFEILPGEEDAVVPVSAVCSGPLIFKSGSVSGYGGVASQRCELEQQTVTVTYGHLQFSSIKQTINTNLKAGEVFAALGRGYSTETDGERKHLHLGIYKGSGGSYLLGYVKTESALEGWFNILDF